MSLWEKTRRVVRGVFSDCQPASVRGWTPFIVRAAGVPASHLSSNHLQPTRSRMKQLDLYSTAWNNYRREEAVSRSVLLHRESLVPGVHTAIATATSVVYIGFVIVYQCPNSPPWPLDLRIIRHPRRWAHPPPTLTTHQQGPPNPSTRASRRQIGRNLRPIMQKGACLCRSSRFTCLGGPRPCAVNRLSCSTL